MYVLNMKFPYIFRGRGNYICVSNLAFVVVCRNANIQDFIHFPAFRIAVRIVYIRMRWSSCQYLICRFRTNVHVLHELLYRASVRLLYQLFHDNVSTRSVSGTLNVCQKKFLPMISVSTTTGTILLWQLRSYCWIWCWEPARHSPSTFTIVIPAQ